MEKYRGDSYDPYEFFIDKEDAVKKIDKMKKYDRVSEYNIWEYKLIGE